MTIIRLEKLLKSKPGGRLDKIVQTAKELQDLTSHLKSGLDDDMAAALLSANLRDDELVLVVTSPEWASRLRFESNGLLAAANAQGHAATRCIVRVAR